MSLIIKSGETHRRGGQTIAERLNRIRAKRNRADCVARVLKIGKECAALPVLDHRTAEEMLYNEHGLLR